MSGKVEFIIQDDEGMENYINSEQVQNIAPGKEVKGRIVSFYPDDENPESVIVDLGSKSEGRIPFYEFDQKPFLGMEVEALVRREDEETGLVRLSKRDLEKKRGWRIVEEAFEQNLPVNALVRRVYKDSFIVFVEGLTMYLPKSEVGRQVGQQSRGIIGQTITVKITQLNRKKRTGQVSRKLFLEEQNQQAWERLKDKVQIGDIVSGKVIGHSIHGVLVEVEGVTGFLHRSNITWERKVGNLKERLPVGTEINLRVLEMEPENNRLSLGLKQLTEDPWEKVLEKIQVGDTVKGKVTYVARYGAFVDLGDGLEGLLHTNEMSWTRRIGHAQDIVQVGQEIETKVLGINVEDKRISLGLRQLQENPWDRIQEEYKIGQVLKGKVKEITSFGLFVSVTDEIDGLVRKEDINWDDPPPNPADLYKVGDEVEYKITEINFEDHKIGCSIRHLLPNPYKELKKKYPRGSVIEGVVSGVTKFGVFIQFDDRFEGLAHISTLRKEESGNPKNHYKKGQTVKAVVKYIEPETRKISLSIKDVDYALEKMEMERYIVRDSEPELTTSPFQALRELVQK